MDSVKPAGGGTRVARPSLGARAIALTTVFMVTPAWSHDWYTGYANPITGEACCNVDDCQRVSPETVKASPKGWIVAPNGEVVPYKQALRSQDRDFHVCRRGAWRQQSQPGPIVCLFTPPFGF